MSIEVTLKHDYKSYKLERFEETAKKLIKGLAKAVLVVERQAKENAPVDTGRLRASITSEVSGMEGKVRTNVEYASYVEHGTSKRPATPFLFPALEQKKREIEELMKGA